MRDLGSTIVDTQNRDGWFWKSIHVFALNVIILTRYRFHYSFLRPVGFYLGHWLIFMMISGVHFALTGARGSLYLKCITLCLYLLQMVVALLNHWFSKNPPPRDSPGTSFLAHVLPDANEVALGGEMPLEWKIHVWYEPIFAGFVGCVVAVFDPYLGALLVASSVALFIKDLHNWHKYRDLYIVVRDPLRGIPKVKRGQPYTPPPQRAAPGRPQSFAAKLKGLVQGNAKPGIRRLPRKSSGGALASPAPQPALNTAAVAPQLTAPPPIDPIEAEHAKVLNVPAGGIRDVEHLRKLKREQAAIYHPDRAQNPAQKAHFDAMSRKVSAAFLYFKPKLNSAAAQSSTP